MAANDPLRTFKKAAALRCYAPIFQYFLMEKVMKMERLNAWMGIAGNIAILLGLIALAVEINANTKALRVQATEDFMAMIQEHKLAFAANVDLQALEAKALLNPAELTPAELLGMVSWIELRINTAERRFDLFKEGVVPETDWQDSLGAVQYYLGTKFGQWAWSEIKKGYAYKPEFVAAIDSELANSKATPNDEWLLAFHEKLANLGP
jgi:hypothetical protein